MKLLGWLPELINSQEVCLHKDRLFTFAHAGDLLLVSEIILGDTVRRVTVEYKMPQDASQNSFASCSLGNRILFMSGGPDSTLFPLLIDIDEGDFCLAKLQVKPLKLQKPFVWGPMPRLGCASKNRAVLYFSSASGLWYCDVKGAVLSMQLPYCQKVIERGFDSAPINLQEGKVLAARSLPTSTDLTIVSTESRVKYVHAGNIPGEARPFFSIVLIKNRFVIGFSERNASDPALSDMWIFDLQRRRLSPIAKSEDWPAQNYLSFMVAAGSALYLFTYWVRLGAASRYLDEGRDLHLNTIVYSLSLVDLARLIQDATLQKDFLSNLDVMKLPNRPTTAEWNSSIQVLQDLYEDSRTSNQKMHTELASAQAQVQQLSTDLAAARNELQLLPQLRASVELSGRELKDARASLSALEANVSKLLPEAGRAASLQAKLTELEAERERLLTELKRATDFFGTLPVTLPFKVLPSLSFSICQSEDTLRLGELITSTRAHQRALPQNPEFAAEYSRIFKGFLTEDSCRRLFLATSVLPARALRECSIAQVTASLAPNSMYPLGSGVSLLPRSHPLRSDRKYLDSLEVRQTKQYLNSSLLGQRVPAESAPPVYRISHLFLDHSDPLSVESWHSNSARLKRVVQIAHEVLSVRSSGDADRVLSVLHRLKRMARPRDDENRAVFPRISRRCDGPHLLAGKPDVSEASSPPHEQSTQTECIPGSPSMLLPTVDHSTQTIPAPTCCDSAVQSLDLPGAAEQAESADQSIQTAAEPQQSGSGGSQGFWGVLAKRVGLGLWEQIRRPPAASTHVCPWEYSGQARR